MRCGTRAHYANIDLLAVACIIFVVVVGLAMFIGWTFFFIPPIFACNKGIYRNRVRKRERARELRLKKA